MADQTLNFLFMVGELFISRKEEATIVGCFGEVIKGLLSL